MTEHVITPTDLVTMSEHCPGGNGKVIREIAGIGIAIEYIGWDCWRIAEWTPDGYVRDECPTTDQAVADAISDWNNYVGSVSA